MQGAIVRLPGRDLTPLYAGDDGHFVTYELEPGVVQLDVRAEYFKPTSCSVVIPQGGGDIDSTVNLKRCRNLRA